MNEEYLDLVIEEAAEVIQSAIKCKRFGSSYVCPLFPGDNSDSTNEERLAYEVGDFLEVLDRLSLRTEEIKKGMERKKQRLKEYGPNSTHAKRGNDG